MDFFSKILDIFFPRKCAGCQSAGAFLCLSCGSKAKSGELLYEDCKIAFDYHNPAVRSAIHMLKYKSRPSVAVDLAKCAHARFENFLSDIQKESGYAKTIIIPLPLHKKRQKERGYNQAELIAKAIIKISGTKNMEMRKDILKKITETKTQVSTKNKSERSKNLRGCFEVVNLKGVQNKNIVILDDIITTGSTLYEARKALARAGAKNIFLFALAH